MVAKLAVFTFSALCALTWCVQSLEATVVPCDTLTYFTNGCTTPPTAWYRMDGSVGSSVGTVPDSRGSWPTAAVYDGSVTFAASQLGTAADVSSGGFRITSPVGPTGGQFSFTLWFKMNTVVSNACLIYRWPTANFPFVLQMNTAGTATHVSFRQSDGTQILANEPTTVPVGVWNHIAIVADGNTMCIFRDAVSRVCSSYDGTVFSLANPDFLDLGHTAGSYRFDGLLDDFRFYDRAIDTGAELRAVACPMYVTDACDSPPTAWYRFDESMGTVARDFLGAWPDASQSSGSLTWETSSLGSAIDFATGSASLQVTNPIAPSSDSFAFTVWVKFASRGSFPNILRYWPNTGNDPFPIIMEFSGGSGLLGVAWFESFAAGYTQKGAAEDGTWPAPAVGLWTHYAAVFDGTQACIYRNGVRTSAFVAYNTVQRGNPPFLDIGGGAGPLMTGSMDDLRFYDRSVTSHEILRIISGSSLATCPLSYATNGCTQAPTAWYRLDESAGTIAEDAQGHWPAAARFAGSPNWVSTPLQYGNGLDMGTGDVEFRIYNPAPPTSDAFAFTWWAKYDTFGSYPSFVRTDGTGAQWNLLITGHGGTGNLKSAFRESVAQGSTTKILFSSGPPAGVWVHYAVVLNGTHDCHWMNGSKVACMEYNTVARGTGGPHLYIGSNSFPVKGTMDDLRYYDRLVPDAEVLEIYNAPMPTTVMATTSAPRTTTAMATTTVTTLATTTAPPTTTAAATTTTPTTAPPTTSAATTTTLPATAPTTTTTLLATAPLTTTTLLTPVPESATTTLPPATPPVEVVLVSFPPLPVTLVADVTYSVSLQLTPVGTLYTGETMGFVIETTGSAATATNVTGSPIVLETNATASNVATLKVSSGTDGSLNLIYSSLASLPSQGDSRRLLSVALILPSQQTFQVWSGDGIDILTFVLVQTYSPTLDTTNVTLGIASLLSTVSPTTPSSAIRVVGHEATSSAAGQPERTHVFTKILDAEWVTIYGKIIELVATDNPLAQYGIIEAINGRPALPPSTNETIGIAVSTATEAAEAITVVVATTVAVAVASAVASSVATAVGASVGSAAAGAAGGAAGGASGGGATGIINQVQFMAITGAMGDDESTDEATTAFADGFAWSNFHFDPFWGTSASSDSNDGAAVRSMGHRTQRLHSRNKRWKLGRAGFGRRTLATSGDDSDDCTSRGDLGAMISMTLLVCSMVLAIVFVARNLLILLIKWWVQRKKKRVNAARIKKGHKPLPITPFSTPFALMFPRWELIVCLVQYMGLAEAAGLSMGSACSGIVLAGAAIVIATPGALLVWGTWYSYSQITKLRQTRGKGVAEFVPTAFPRPTEFKSAWQEFKNCKEETWWKTLLARKTVAQSAWHLVKYSGDWEAEEEEGDRIFTSRIDPMIGDYRQHGYFYFTVDLVKKFATGIMLGVSNVSAKSAMILTLFIIECIFLVLRRPYKDRFTNVVEVGTSLTRLVVLIAVAATVNGTISAAVNSVVGFVANITGTVIQLVSQVGTMLGMVFGIFGAVGSVIGFFKEILGMVPIPDGDLGLGLDFSASGIADVASGVRDDLEDLGQQAATDGLDGANAAGEVVADAAENVGGDTGGDADGDGAVVAGTAVAAGVLATDAAFGRGMQSHSATNQQQGHAPTNQQKPATRHPSSEASQRHPSPASGPFQPILGVPAVHGATGRGEVFEVDRGVVDQGFTNGGGPGLYNDRQDIIRPHAPVHPNALTGSGRHGPHHIRMSPRAQYSTSTRRILDPPSANVQAQARLSPTHYDPRHDDIRALRSAHGSYSYHAGGTTTTDSARMLEQSRARSNWSPSDRNAGGHGRHGHLPLTSKPFFEYRPPSAGALGASAWVGPLNQVIMDDDPGHLTSSRYPLRDGEYFG